MNQTEWQENTLLEIEEQLTPSSHTNTPQKHVDKRLEDYRELAGVEVNVLGQSPRRDA
jgi:hypothetical protein